jgi:sigma-54 specific flagellar transcriptional regulator A
MRNLAFAVLAGDEARAERLRWLLECLGGRLVPPADAGVVCAVADGHGQWPSLDASTVPVIEVGEEASGERYLASVATLPWPPTYDGLLAALHTAQSQLRQQAFGRIEDFQTLRGLVGTSENMLRVRSLIAKVAASDATVLVTGESGTGKELVARALHERSKRSNGPFVPVNCGAIPGELLESELFGHERGAFTGAISTKAGRFELAAGGTLFLDEIGDMPLPMQVKVLRALQDRCFERVGGAETLHADVRIVAATHRNLEQMIHEGLFREDLFYRLNVFPIELAPLRERIEDLPMLVQAITERIAGEQGLSVRLTLDAMQSLAEYSWPGNVRELRNVLERMAIQYPNELVATGDLPPKYRGEEAARPADAPLVEAAPPTGLLPVNGLNLKEYLAELECSLIEQALEDTNSVVARAADRLHIRRTTLVEKMRKYGIERS